jgi:hypothetical protein
MGFMQFLTEQTYILFSMYYYEVFLYKDNIQVGRIIQSLSFSPDYIVDFKRKLGWIIVKGKGFVKGHKIILHYKLDYGLPLIEVEEEKIDEINSGLVKITKIKKLIGSATKEEKEKSKPIDLITEYNFPPHMIFELINAGFVTKVSQKGKSTDWGFVIMVVAIVAFLIAFMAIIVFGVLK